MRDDGGDAIELSALVGASAGEPPRWPPSSPPPAAITVDAAAGLAATIGGEAIARLLGLAQRAFASTFGHRCAEVRWPDAPEWASLPQLTASAGFARMQVGPRAGDQPGHLTTGHLSTGAAAATATGRDRGAAAALLREAELWWASAVDLRRVPRDRVADVGTVLDRAWRAVVGRSPDGAGLDVLEVLVAEALDHVARPAAAIANPSSFARDEVVESRSRPTGDGPRQALADGRVAFRAACPALGVVEARPLPVDDRVVVTERTMANSRLAVAWDLEGAITSLIDVAAGRDIVPDGERVAQFVGTEAARTGSARIGSTGLEPARIELVDAGPVVGRVRLVRPCGGRDVDVCYVLRAGSPRLDIEVAGDHRPDRPPLSLAFPVDVHADEATWEIPFGHVRRPARARAPDDGPRFEVGAGWIDLSEPSFGVAVLAVRGAEVAVAGGTMIAAVRPVPAEGPAVIAVLPHGTGLDAVVRASEALAVPLRAVPASTGAAPADAAPVVELDPPAARVSAIKTADDGSGDLIVRLCEPRGDRASVTVRRRRPITAASLCDLLEVATRPLDVSDGIVVLRLAPFQVVTVRLSDDIEAD